jgi:hypothetical protein
MTGGLTGCGRAVWWRWDVGRRLPWRCLDGRTVRRGGGGALAGETAVRDRGAGGCDGRLDAAGGLLVRWEGRAIHRGCRREFPRGAQHCHPVQEQAQGGTELWEGGFRGPARERKGVGLPDSKGPGTHLRYTDGEDKCQVVTCVSSACSPSMDARAVLQGHAKHQGPMVNVLEDDAGLGGHDGVRLDLGIDPARSLQRLLARRPADP